MGQALVCVSAKRLRGENYRKGAGMSQDDTKPGVDAPDKHTEAADANRMHQAVVGDAKPEIDKVDAPKPGEGNGAQEIVVGVYDDVKEGKTDPNTGKTVQMLISRGDDYVVYLDDKNWV